MVLLNPERMVDEFGAAEWYGQLRGFPGSGWFLLHAAPVPPSADERRLVAADIVEEGASRRVRVWDGRVRHSPDCGGRRHDLPRRLRQVVERHLPRDEFLIGVCPDTRFPAAIALKPEVSYDVFPDHIHLYPCQRGALAPDLVLPDSLCYTTGQLDDDEDKRVIDAFHHICVWLFRHQVWRATREGGEGAWIGPQLPFAAAGTRANRLNPRGPCWCRGGRGYADCHLLEDVAAWRKCGRDEALPSFLELVRPGRWEERVGTPQAIALRSLQAAFSRTAPRYSIRGLQGRGDPVVQ